MRRIKLLFMVLIVAMVIVSSIATYLTWQAQESREQKYEVVSILVGWCTGSTNGIVQGLPGMYDDSLPMVNRSRFADTAQVCLWDLHLASMAIATSYEPGSDEDDAFTALETAAYYMTVLIKIVAKDMWLNVTLSTEYVENETVRTGALETVRSFSMIGNMLLNGTDPARDFSESPYSLLDGMNLEVIGNAADNVTAIASPLVPPGYRY